MSRLSKEVDIALRTSQQGFQALVEANIVGVAIGDEDTIHDANDKFLDMVGYTHDDMVAGLVNWRAMAAPESVEQDQRAFEEMVAEGACAPFEKAYIRKDGTLIHTLVGAAITRRQPLEWISFVVDLSQRKQFEDQINELYKREHRIAESLQSALINQPQADTHANVEVETVYMPALDEADVGGDYFDVFPLGSGQLALVVGDVSGKGLEAARRTAEIKYSLRAYLMEHQRPAKALSLLNTFLCMVQQIDTELRQFFVALSVACLDTNTGMAYFAAGGSEPPFVVRTSGAVDEVPSHNLPLGIAGDAEYSEWAIEAGVGDVIIMATDGITEARRGKDFLGTEGLVSLARKAMGRSDLEEIGQAIIEGTIDFSSGVRHDDICLVLARRTAACLAS